MDLEHRVSILEAIEEIKGLKAVYAGVCDTGYKPEGMFPLFVENALWVDATGRFGRHEGRKAICDFFAGVSGSIGWALHYMIAPKITVHDDLVSAEGTWYLWQPCTINGNPVWLTGTYFDRYAKEDGVWKFSEVQLSVQTMSPFDEGWVKRPFLGE
jgi:hypothetical protein